jgi:hypothetical protein
MKLPEDIRLKIEKSADKVRWSRLSEQFFRADKWSVCRG